MTLTTQNAMAGLARNPVTWAVGRVFVDVASSGCGSGCSYCYIDAPAAQQITLAAEDVEAITHQLVASDRFVPGSRGTLVSLSPNSEPFKSEESVEAVSRILQTVLPLGNPIQIPTKEIVPQKIVDILDRLATDERQVVIFISLSSFDSAHRLEPHAAPLSQRLYNGTIIHGHKAQSCAYIKPFLASALSEIDSFVEAINSSQFDVACVGMRYAAASASGAASGIGSRPLSRQKAPHKGGAHSARSVARICQVSC